MWKIATKLHSLCTIRSRTHVRVRPPPPRSENKEQISNKEVEKGSGSGGGQKIMVVVDYTVEAENAVQWALSHIVQDQDMLIFLHVTKPSSKRDAGVKVPEFLTSMKNYWQTKRPEVPIEVKVVEGREKGPAVVAAAKKEGAAVLVVGQKKQSVTCRLMAAWAGNEAGGGGAAEYCVKNATCMAIAVRRRSNKLGGFVISTKHQKGFWLLA